MAGVQNVRFPINSHVKYLSDPSSSTTTQHNIMCNCIQDAASGCNLAATHTEIACCSLLLLLLRLPPPSTFIPNPNAMHAPFNHT